MLVLNNGAFIVLFDPDETRDAGGKLLNPPQLFVLMYDAERDEATKERISFLAAKTLSREKFEVAMRELAEARRVARAVADAAAADEAAARRRSYELKCTENFKSGALALAAEKDARSLDAAG